MDPRPRSIRARTVCPWTVGPQADTYLTKAPGMIRGPSSYLLAVPHACCGLLACRVGVLPGGGGEQVRATPAARDRALWSFLVLIQ